MFTPKFTFSPICLDYLSNIRSGISKQAGLFVRHGVSFFFYAASGFKAVIQLHAGNKACVFISTLKRTYLLFISHCQERHDSVLFCFLQL